jgi:hypothetical protein
MAGITKVNGVNVVAGNGLGPRTRILSLAKTSISASEVTSVVEALAQGGTAGTDDAVTITGYVATGANEVHVAVQGTGALTAGANYRGVTGVTMAVVADFDQNP